MANVALIIAGGVGERMGNAIPKQFMDVAGKPVLVWTISAFQSHHDIDAIYVVCLNGWEQEVLEYKEKYKLSKLEQVVTGGDTGFQSIRNGLNAIAEKYKNDDIVLIHDAVRPMVSHEIISDNIATVKKYGNAITCIPCYEAMLYAPDGRKATKSVPRETLQRTQTPQGFKLSSILRAHALADSVGITNSVASCTLFAELGLPTFISRGSEKNIKLTTTDDIDILEVLIKAKNQNENKSIFKRARAYKQRNIKKMRNLGK